MYLTLSPQRRDDAMNLTVMGDLLTINGVDYDLSPLPEGATLPAEAIGCEWIIGEVTRRDGELHLTMILPYGPIPWPAPPESRVVTHPEALHVTEDGPVALPTWAPAEAEPVEITDDQPEVLAEPEEDAP